LKGGFALARDEFNVGNYIYLDPAKEGDLS
jgi:hypothetical protein